MAKFSITASSAGTNTGNETLKVDISELGSALSNYYRFCLTNNTGSTASSMTDTALADYKLKTWTRGTDGWTTSSTGTSITLYADAPAHTHTAHILPAQGTSSSANTRTVQLYANTSGSTWYLVGDATTPTKTYYAGYAWLGSATATQVTTTSVNLKGIARVSGSSSWYKKIGISTSSTTYNLSESSILQQADFTSNTDISFTGLTQGTLYYVHLKGADDKWYRAHNQYRAGSTSSSTAYAFRFRTTPNTVVSTTGPINYDGSSHNLVSATNTTNKSIYYKVGTGSWGSANVIPTASAIGTYNIYWYTTTTVPYIGAQGSSSSPMGPVQTVIQSATPTYTAPTAKTNLTYTGNAQILVNEGTCTNGVLWYQVEQGADDITVPWTNDINYVKDSEAGTYKISYYVKGNTGYSDIGSQDNPIGYVTTIINKADPVLTAPTEKTGLIYTGSAQQLINAGSSSHGTFYYRVGTSGSFSTSATSITGTNVGTYTIQWYLYGDNNHNDYGRETGPGGYEYEELTVTISNKPTATWSTQPTIKTNLTYTGSAQQLINAGASSGGTPQYRIGTSGTWQTSVTVTAMKGTNADTYTVQCYILGDSTHTDSSILTLYPVINKADIPSNAITAPTGVSVYYDGSYHQLVNAGSVSSTYGTMYYKQDGPGTNWVTDPAVITASEEGEYWTYWKITGTSNYNDYTPSLEYVVSTISAMPTPTYTAPSGRTVTWSSGDINLVTAGTVTNGSFHYKVGTGSWSQANTIPTTTTVGTYTIYWYIKGNTGYADIGSTTSPAGSVTTTINKANITSYSAPTVKTVTYTGSNQQLINAGSVTNNYGTMYYKCPEAEIDWTSTASNIVGKDAGDYLVYYYIVGDSNHNNVGSTSSPIGYKTVTIAKAAAYTWTTSPSKKTGLTYTGSAQALITTGTPSGGTAQYKLSTATSYGTSAPTATNAGTYTVDYYIKGDANHEDSSVLQLTSIQIAQKSAGSAASVDVNYNGNLQYIITPSVNNGTIRYKVTNDESSFSTTRPQRTNADTYTIQYYITPSDTTNYAAVGSSGSPISVTSYIRQVAATYSAPTAKTLTYTGNTQQLVNAGSVTGGTMYYRVGTSGSWVEVASATGTNATSYSVYYYIEPDSNHTHTSSQSNPLGPVSITIGKANPTYTAPTAKTNLTYTGSLQQLVNAGSTSHGTLYYRIGTSGTWQTSVTVDAMKGTNADTYNIYYYLTGDSNHNNAGTSSSPLGPVSVTIGKATPSYTAPTGKSLSYTGSNQTLINAGTTTTGCTMYYKLDSGSWSTSLPQASAVGTYTIYYYIVGNSNYNDRGSTSSPLGNITATIGQSVPTYTAPTAKTGLVYNGSAKQLINAGTVTNGTLYYRVGTSGSFVTTASSITGTNAGDYTIYYYIKGDTGYSDIGSTSNPAGSIIATIAKTDPTLNTDPTGITIYYNGSAQSIVTAGSVTNGTLYYKVDNGSWSTTATASSISTDYKVYYYVKGNTNYNDIGSESTPIGYVSSQILSSVAVYNGTQWVRSSVTGYYESNSIYSKCLIYYYDGSAWQLCGYQEN